MMRWCAMLSRCRASYARVTMTCVIERRYASAIIERCYFMRRCYTPPSHERERWWAPSYATPMPTLRDEMLRTSFHFSSVPRVAETGYADERAQKHCRHATPLLDDSWASVVTARDERCWAMRLRLRDERYAMREIVERWCQRWWEMKRERAPLTCRDAKMLCRHHWALTYDAMSFVMRRAAITITSKEQMPMPSCFVAIRRHTIVSRCYGVDADISRVADASRATPRYEILFYDAAMSAAIPRCRLRLMSPRWWWYERCHAKRRWQHVEFWHAAVWQMSDAAMSDYAWHEMRCRERWWYSVIGQCQLRHHHAYHN